MKDSRYIASPMRPRRRNSADKIVSAGLAAAACAGLVGVIGVRTMDQSAAAETIATDAPAAAQGPAMSSQGLTEQQLDEYAQQLAAESAKLDAYRTELAKAAKKLKRAQAADARAAAAAAQSYSVPSTPTTSSKPAAKPAAKPAPASKPQSSSKSS